MVAPTLCSHYVPKRHIKRFMNENGKVIVYHDGGKRKDEISDFKNIKLLGMNNCYDFCINPNEKNSNEKRYEKTEEDLGDELDRLLNGDTYSELKIKQYVSFLESRSLSKRLLIERYKPYEKNPKYCNSVDSVKEFHQSIIDSSLQYLSTYPLFEY